MIFCYIPYPLKVGTKQKLCFFQSQWEASKTRLRHWQAFPGPSVGVRLLCNPAASLGICNLSATLAIPGRQYEHCYHIWIWRSTLYIYVGKKSQWMHKQICPNTVVRKLRNDPTGALRKLVVLGGVYRDMKRNSKHISHIKQINYIVANTTCLLSVANTKKTSLQLCNTPGLHDGVTFFSTCFVSIDHFVTICTSHILYKSMC